MTKPKKTMTIEEYQACYPARTRHPITKATLSFLATTYGDKNVSFDEWNVLFDEHFTVLASTGSDSLDDDHL